MEFNTIDTDVSSNAQVVNSTTSSMNVMNVINITSKELRQCYLVDNMTCQEIADKYSMTYQETKSALRIAGCTVKASDKPRVEGSSRPTIMVDGIQVETRKDKIRNSATAQ